MGKLKFKAKVLYSVAGIGDSALYNIMGSFALFFLTTIAGVHPAAAGTITAVGSVWNTLCGVVNGYVSDNIEARAGKRKPFLLIAAIPLMLFTSLFFLNIDTGETFKVLYYTVMIILFWTAFSMFFVPYLAWGAELTDDYDERTVLRGYVSFFYCIGSLIGLVLPNILVSWVTAAGYTAAAGWQITGIFCGVVSGGAVLVAATGTKDRSARGCGAAGDVTSADGESMPKQKQHMNALIEIAKMFRNYVQLMKMRTVRDIMGASVFFLIGYAIFCSDRMYFFTYNMDMSGVEITVIMMIFTFIAVAFIPLISGVTRWIDKRTTYIASMMISTVGMVIFGFSGIRSFAGVVVLSLIYSVGNSAYWQLLPAMIYDVCEADELLHRKERAGMVISLQALAEALSEGIGLQLMGMILSLAGFSGDAEVQTATAMHWTGLSLTIIPAVFMALSVVCVIRYPITKKVYGDVLDALARRKAGEEPDLEPFRKLK